MRVLACLHVLKVWMEFVRSQQGGKRTLKAMDAGIIREVHRLPQLVAND
jgi:hypothetical protein